MIQRVFFDFGGCLDAPGIHTRVLFWDAFLAEKLLPSSEREIFQEAYTFADQRMMSTGEAKNLNLSSFNRWNANLIGEKLKLDPARCSRAGDRVTDLMRAYLCESKESLKLFHGRYELGIISNFTGNLQVILREFDLSSFFDTVTESFYVGASKPDPKIFHAALASQKHASEFCLYIGDNPVNDIEPARALGMKTALIHPKGKFRECGADFYGDTLLDLFSKIQSK